MSIKKYSDSRGKQTVEQEWQGIITPPLVCLTISAPDQQNPHKHLSHHNFGVTSL